MPVKQIISFLSISCISFFSVTAQVGGEPFLLPRPFLMIEQSGNFNNPALRGIDRGTRINTLSWLNFGVFSPAYTIYAEGYTGIGDTTGSRNVLGIQFYNDREGPSINKTRAHASYTIHLPVSRKWTMSAGGAVGFAGYFEDGNNMLSSISDESVDANAGIAVYKEELKFGAAIHHIFDSEIVPFNQVIRLPRYFLLTADAKLIEQLNYSIWSRSYFRYVPEFFNVLNTQLQTVFLRNRVTLGMGLMTNYGYYISAGLKQFELATGNADLSLLYFINSANSEFVRINHLELQLGYKF